METTASAPAGRSIRPIAWLRAHPGRADLILATALTALSLTAHLVGVEGEGRAGTIEPTWWTVPLILVSVFPIAWRRTRTEAVAVVVVASQIVTELVDVDGTGFIGVLVAIYSLGAHSQGPTRTRLVAVIFVALGALFVAGVLTDNLDLGSLISSTIILTTAFVLGDNLRRRREAAAAAEERAARAERERELIAQQQLSAERGRIARELHDVVAHSVSVMVIQAAAARRSLESSPANAEQALSNIEETGRRTMDELRGILGVLRRSDLADSGDPTLAPQPTLAEVVDLVAVADDLPIDAHVTDDLHDLPQSVTLTGYRVVQEALTNVRRHAGPVRRVEVSVARCGDDAEESIEIVVADDGRGAAADDTGPGYGLLGMRERVAAVGGTITAGSRAGGGWRIEARLPIRSARPVATVDGARR